MLTLTIDGRTVDVEPAATVYEAAARAGISVPALCHVRGLEPVSSCFVCAVQVEGRRGFQPSCALPAADGMVVSTNSEAVRRSRKQALELLLSDHAGDCEPPCSQACPAGLDIPGFVRAVGRSEVLQARAVVFRRVALPGVLGRICPRLCEQHCRRAGYDQALSIGALHRFVSDSGGNDASPLPDRQPSTGKSVAIIGAGPAGLAAAFHLLQAGHRAVLLDAHECAGGMLRYAIPAHRLPKEALENEIGVIRRLGAEFRMGRRWGADFRLADLRGEFDAVFIATGAQRPQSLRCEGEELAIPALAFLEQVSRVCPPRLGSDVVVAGGGNTALDCARAALRLRPGRVRILYRRTAHEMPCLLSEAEEALAEGVEMQFLVAPVSLSRAAEGQLALTCQRMALGPPDASGRPRPGPVPGSEFTLTCSDVIAALGQSVELTLAQEEGLRTTAWGIDADPRTLQTNLPGVFAGGDAVLGPDLAVRAVAAGRLAASSIHQFLGGEAPTGDAVRVAVALTPMDDDERAALFRQIERAGRVPVRHLDLERRRTSFDEVEAGLSPDEAKRESGRCMTCGCAKAESCTLRALATEYGADVNRFRGERRRFSRDVSHAQVVYEPGKCILCQACTRIAARMEEPWGLALLGRGFKARVAPPFDLPFADGLQFSALQCAEACPTGAIVLRPGSPCPGQSASEPAKLRAVCS